MQYAFIAEVYIDIVQPLFIKVHSAVEGASGI